MEAIIKLSVYDGHQLDTLIHCLKYGYAAASQQERESGEAARRQTDIETFRQQLHDQLTE